MASPQPNSDNSESFHNLKVGSTFNEGTVIKMCYATTEFKIFFVTNRKDKHVQVEYITLDDKRFNTVAISNQLGKLAYLLHDSKADEINAYKDTIADAIASCFMKDEDNAVNLIDDLIAEVTNEVYKWSKLFYLFPCLLIGFSFIGLLLFLESYDECHKFILNQHIFKEAVIMATLGAFGGLFSIAREIESYNVQIKRLKSSKYLPAFIRSLWGPHLVGVLVRMMIACMGSVILLLVIKSKVIQIAGISIDNIYSIYMLGVLGGFSQSLVPGLLTRIEARINKDGEPKPTNSAPNQQTGHVPDDKSAKTEAEKLTPQDAGVDQTGKPADGSGPDANKPTEQSPY